MSDLNQKPFSNNVTLNFKFNSISIHIIVYEDLCFCSIDWKQAFDRVNWTKLMQVLKGTGIDWRERRLISNLYMAQNVGV